MLLVGVGDLSDSKQDSLCFLLPWGQALSTEASFSSHDLSARMPGWPSQGPSQVCALVILMYLFLHRSNQDS